MSDVQVPDCRRCEDEIKAKMADAVTSMMRSFIVCPECGNKRCPKATDHRLTCTNSNEPNQPGSDYWYASLRRWSAWVHGVYIEWTTDSTVVPELRFEERAGGITVSLHDPETDELLMVESRFLGNGWVPTDFNSPLTCYQPAQGVDVPALPVHKVERFVAQLRELAGREPKATRGWTILHEAADFIARTYLPETD